VDLFDLKDGDPRHCTYPVPVPMLGKYLNVVEFGWS